MRVVSQSHTHEQSTESATWTINHGLNTKPAVDVSVVYDGVLQVILPMKIEHISNSQVVVSFSKPFAGVARLR